MAKRTTEAPDLDAIFAALAHPVRRAIIERLSAGDASVNELARPFRVSLPTISRHLAVLESAGLVSVDREWRIRRRHINAGPLGAAFGWLTQYRVLWEQQMDRLSALIEVAGRETPSHKPQRRKRTP
jgi:DNA-binding transcriptional ArsR family regulator